MAGVESHDQGGYPNENGDKHDWCYKRRFNNGEEEEKKEERNEGEKVSKAGDESLGRVHRRQPNSGLLALLLALRNCEWNRLQSGAVLMGGRRHGRRT